MASLKPSRVGQAAPLMAALLMAAGVAGTASAPAGTAQAAEISQQQVEAAYLYKFADYVTWPDSAFPGPASPLVIGVADEDAVADELTGLAAGRSVGGRPVEVRRVRGAGQLVGVNILFIGGQDAAELFASSQKRPILVVAEGKEGLARGGAISFVLIDNRVRFDVSLPAVQQNGLKLSALLLSVAHQVNGVSP